MRLFGILIVFVFGLAVGWMLHLFATKEQPYVAEYQKEIEPQSSVVAVQKSVDHLISNVPPSAQDNIASLFERGDHKEILRRLENSKDSGLGEFSLLFEGLILYLQQAAQGGKLKMGQDLLLNAREMFPNEPRLLYFSAELALASEDHFSAISRFYELRDSRQEMFPDGQINQRLGLLIDAYRYRLQKQKQTDKLLKLYQLVVSRDQTRPEFFYELAKLHFELRNLEQARSMLSYVLSDMVWGKRSQELLTQINRFEMLQVEYHSQIPLRRLGKHFLLTSLINGNHEVTLLLDTGASFTTLAPKLLIELGLNQSDLLPVALETGGGRITAHLYYASTMAVGDQAINNIVIAGVPLGDNLKADGLLGMNFLSHFEFFIDQEQAILYLRPKI